MPPVVQSPVLSQPIQNQMDALRKQYHALDVVIGRLKSLTGATLAVQQELAHHAREESKAIESKIEDLRILADEQDRESDRTLILNMLEKIEDQFKQQQQSLRQAILSSKQNIDREAKSERELLLQGSKSAIELSEIRRRGASKGNSSEYMLNTSKDHNESLGRTLKLMQQEVERTAHSAKVIDESSKTLRSTVGQYQTYDEVLKRGKNLITKLNQADWTDRLLIGFGLLVFSLVVMYILKKRIADRGISLVGYFFMPLRWLLSLLIPSLRTVPSEAVREKVAETAPLLTEVVAGHIKEFVAGSVAGSAAEEVFTVGSHGASTTAAQGLLGFLDAVVGE